MGVGHHTIPKTRRTDETVLVASKGFLAANATEQRCGGMFCNNVHYCQTALFLFSRDQSFDENPSTPEVTASLLRCVRRVKQSTS